MVVIRDKSVINRINKPKTRKGKRFLESREPKLTEDTKQTIFMRSSTASQLCVQLSKDFCLLKKPNSVYFSRKESWHPFEDSSHIEFLCHKNNSSLFMFANHTKKRPNNVTIGRTFDEHILDMVELAVDAYKPLMAFKTPKIPIGTKPIVIFSGEQFDVDDDYQRIRNLLLDFFGGPNVDAIRLSGLEHVIQFVATAGGGILMRSYRVLLKKSGTRVPRIELEEMGPRVDLTVRRTRFASQDLFKRSLRRPLELIPKKVKNVKRDQLGSTLGRIHMNRQDFRQLSLRKSKAFRKSSQERRDDSGGQKRTLVPVEEEVVGEDNRVSNGDNKPKKRVRFSV